MVMKIGFLIEELQKSGVTFDLDDGKIRVHAADPSVLRPEAISALREHKAEAVSYLEARFSGFPNLGPGKPENRLQSPVDAYAERLRVALLSVCNPSYPAGLIPWLGEHRPDLYHMLITTIPDTLHKLWSSNGPIEQFEAALATWRRAHEEAIRAYNKATKRSNEPWNT